ncbi:hypothetical protein ABTZ93_38880 [Streptomyces sp. NPDC097941]|uniref:hypothetical protein n=1 Tax=Streptomyces sp. NPDC097941 TaxID=3155685 RepID=UPI003319D20D
MHRQLVPVWRRRTRHGRVLSLEADLGDGLSLRDLVVADVDLLSRTVASVFEDERLNTVLAKLAPAERAVVFAYAEGEGTTWTEAASAVGAAEAFGERVRRKAKRLADEQPRRAALRRPNDPSRPRDSPTVRTSCAERSPTPAKAPDALRLHPLNVQLRAHVRARRRTPPFV